MRTVIINVTTGAMMSLLSNEIVDRIKTKDGIMVETFRLKLVALGFCRTRLAFVVRARFTAPRGKLTHGHWISGRRN